MGKVKFVKCTAAQYAELSSGGRVDSDTIYFETTNHRIYLGGACYSNSSTAEQSPVEAG